MCHIGSEHRAHRIVHHCYYSVVLDDVYSVPVGSVAAEVNIAHGIVLACDVGLQSYIHHRTSCHRKSDICE